MKVYEVVTSEPWGDKTASGTRVIRWLIDVPLIVALRQDTDFALGLFSELEVGKGLARWSPWREGAIALHNIQRIIEVKNE